MAAVLTELLVGDEPSAWEGAGFTVDGDHSVVGSVTIRFAGSEGGRGILGWTLAGVGEASDIDGLATTSGTAPPQGGAGGPHPNGVVALDHIVVVTPDLDRTMTTLESLGIEARRIREVGTPDAPRRQVFFWLGEPILELVGGAGADGEGPARFWGLACTTDDIDATATHLGERVGRVKDAVQPGRRITTLRHRELDMSVPVAFMSPHPRSDSTDA
jgi:hypothetical protein